MSKVWGYLKNLLELGRLNRSISFEVRMFEELFFSQYPKDKTVLNLHWVIAYISFRFLNNTLQGICCLH